MIPLELDVTVFIIIMIFTGAWTGYITNDVAIKMLFREYGIGRFKLGGVIVKTRKDLEKNLSLLVEKEIINHNTLKSQFHKKELKEIISKTVVSFFNDAIFKNSKNVKLSELSGFDKTSDNLLTFLRKYLTDNLTDFFIDMSKNVELSDIASSEQAYNLAVTITNQILLIMKDKRILEVIIKELYDNYHEVSIDKLIGDEITNTIINNLNELLNNIFDEMRYKNDHDIQLLISKLYRDLDFDTFVETLEKYVGDKKLSYFISESSLEKLYDLFMEYLKNPSSKESIEVFCEGLIIALKKIDKPIIELFTGDLRIEVEKFLETQLPGIIDKLIEVVQKNSHEIEELIESSIDQTIYDQQTIKRLILSAIRVFLIENFTKKYDIINKIVEMLKGIDIEDLSKTVSEQVVDLLHHKSIANIINELEENNILTTNIISVQVHKILTFLCERYLSKDIEHADILNKQIKQIIKINLKPFVNNITVSIITKQIIYNEDVLRFIKTQIGSALKGITKMPINIFILDSKVNDFASSFQEIISKKLNNNHDEILDIVYKHLNNYFINNNLSSIINKNNDIEFKSEIVVDVIIKSLSNLIDDNKNYKVHDLFNQINSIDNLSENVVNTIMDYLDNGLSNILEGNIAKVVEENIKSLSNEEVLEMMQEFMGSKLKPLTILGACFGGIVGLALGFSLDTHTIFNFNNLPLILGSMGIYALLGYITNVFAIFFIFRPYKPLFGFKWFHGVIPKQIPVLAKAMGNIVSNNLLNQESINNMIINNELKLKKDFINNIENDDYRVLKTYFSENSDQIVNNSTRYIIKYLRDNNSMLATKFTDEVLKFSLKNIETSIFVQVFAKIFTEKINDSSQSISKFIASNFKSSKSIKELSDELSINTIENRINSIIENEVLKFIDKFSNNTYLISVIKNNSNKIDELITKQLNDVVPDTTKLAVENFLYNFISEYLFSRGKQRSLSNYVITEITTILNNNDSIDELFGGRFIELVNFNMSTILEKIDESVQNWLISYRDEINESVTKHVVEELTVVQQVGYKAINGDKLIRETVYRIIEKKLPEFISQKMESLNNDFNNFFVNFGKIRLKDAKLELRKEELQDYLSEVFESKEIEIKTRRFIHVVMGYFYEFKTYRVFDILGIKSTQDIINKYKDIFILVNNGTYNTIDVRKDKIVFDVSMLINKFITKEILSNKVRNLTLGITGDQIDRSVKNLLSTLNQNDFLYNNLTQLIDAVLLNLVKLPINEIFDDLYLKQDMKKLIKKLTIDREFEEGIYHSIHNLFTLTTNDFTVIIDNDLKLIILHNIIDSTYDVVKVNLVDILKAVDFKEVTIREISSMEPQKIKQLFYSFGGKYFHKLEYYGVFGGIFAIELISLAMFVPYIINYNKKEKK